MKAILKYTKVNVKVTNETGTVLFEGHNLFVDSGRALIASIFTSAYSFDPTNYLVCDLGDDAAVPSSNNLDLAMIDPPFSGYPVASIQMNTGFPVTLSGEATGVHFQFSYTASGDQTFRELGLFYRPYVVGVPGFPARGEDTTLYTGIMIARLKTTLSSIVVGNGRTITIDWKILF